MTEEIKETPNYYKIHLGILDKELKKQEKEFLGKIGLLRQWLNEERITDPKKMVSNEEIKKLLT